MFQLHLSTQFDSRVFTQKTTAFDVYAGPQKLLHWIEEQLGLDGLPDNTEYLRIELFRQALQQLVHESTEAVFYANSLQADRYATAQTLLGWRDQLHIGGWDFKAAADSPERLVCLAAVESRFQQKINAPANRIQAQGFADRYVRIFNELADLALPIQSVCFYEPEHLLAPVFQTLAAIWKAQSVSVQFSKPERAGVADSDLGHFTSWCLGETKEKKPAQGDGSLLLLRMRRDSDAAPFIAAVQKNNPGWRPLVLLPEMDRILEEASLREHLPAMGVLSTSQARPSLQVLKLAPAFLWEPVDVRKIMEFVTLALKPIEDDLATEIARLLAEKPGLFHDAWFARIYSHLEAESTPAVQREQYNFWFNRKRYPQDGAVPKSDVIALYDYIHQWAKSTYKDQGSSVHSLLVLAEQSRRVRDLMEALPESRVSYLELERMVRTIYAPSPVQLSEPELGHLLYIHHPGAMAASTDTLLWWNFVHDSPTVEVDHWQQEEFAYFQKAGVRIENAAQLGRRNLFHRISPVRHTQKQLLVLIPEQCAGKQSIPHLLSGDMEACFEDLNKLEFQIEKPEDRNRLTHYFKLGNQEDIPIRERKETPLFLQVEHPESMLEHPYETPTNLEALFYYPHRWFFRKKLQLAPVQLYAVAPDRRLLGNLAHRFFELFFNEKPQQWDKQMVLDFVSATLPGLLEKEGATLLLYGREPERKLFQRKLQHAAWALLSLIRQNGWDLLGTELDLEGTFCGIPVKGKADLVLQRGEEKAILDLKWSGASHRKNLIRSEEDLQLVLYGELLRKNGPWPHSAYFILEQGQLIARNTEGFKEATVPGQAANHQEVNLRILERMQRTFEWRMEQVRSGKIELRRAQNAEELDALYESIMLHLLEMKKEDARFDDYNMLLEFAG